MRKLPWLIVLILIPLVGPVSAAGAGADGSATFNVPRPFGGPEANFAIIKRVERAIDGVPAKKPGKPRPVIAVTSFLLDRSASVDALIRACRRGVSVRVILDGEINNRNSRRLISALNGDNVKDKDGDGKADTKPKARKCNRPLKKKSDDRTVLGRSMPTEEPGLWSVKKAIRSVDAPMGDDVTWGKDRSYVKRCSTGCRSGLGNMHTKMYVFSKTKKTKKVVMVASTNLNRGGAYLGWNDMYVMNNRPKSYDQYLKVHRLMTLNRKAPKQRIEIKDGPFTSRFFPILKAGKKKDPALSDLNKIKCKSALGPTRVHISMFYWKGHRGNYLADKILNLARSGCQVSIIYGAPSRAIAQRLRDAAGRGLIQLYDSRWDFNEDGFNEVRTHSKYVLVRGTFGKNNRAHVVMTGSPNWVVGSLNKGDESTLNIALKSAYNSYLGNWVRVRNNSRKLPYN